jgi:3' exoribonuclease, RNase T-like
MRIWYDTEFIEDGRTIDLISIGMVREDGAELYLINGNHDVFDRAVKHRWLVNNVVPSLPVKLDPADVNKWEWDRSHPDWGDLTGRKDLLVKAVLNFIVEARPAELWAWYAAYDHVALCQLWGPMINLPGGIPMWTNDLKQECMRLGNPEVPEQEGTEHNALDDARHAREIHLFLEETERQQKADESTEWLAARRNV